MSTETRRRKKGGIFLLPFLTALPMIAVLAFLAFRFGPTIRKLISILIKMAVTA